MGRLGVAARGVSARSVHPDPSGGAAADPAHDPDRTAPRRSGEDLLDGEVRVLAGAVVTWQVADQRVVVGLKLQAEGLRGTARCRFPISPTLPDSSASAPFNSEP